MIKNTNWKVAIIAIQIILFCIAGLAYYFLNEVCLAVGDCDSFTRREFWRPLFFSGISWAVILSPFLFLPTQYFTAYFKKVFWWAALLFFLNVAANDGSSSEWVDRTDMVFISGAITAVITLVFTVLHYRESKKS
jgi:hypothetical protein